MKKIYVLLLFCGSLCCFSQTSITLTFLGKDISTQQSINLQSVDIKNTTIGCDTVIYGSPPAITLTMLLGIEEQDPNGSEPFSIVSATPNPFSCITSMSVFIRQPLTLHMQLIGIKGELISQCQNKLSRGLQRFEIRASYSGLMTLVVSDGTRKKSFKLLSQTLNSCENSITYTGQDNPKSENNTVRSETSGFVYHHGDQLLYKGTATGYGDQTITDSPVQSNTYTFQMTANATGQPCPGLASVTDIRDGQSYPTVQIGAQCWLQKNMNFLNGNSWCYDSTGLNCELYGRLYDWQSAQGACPSGWHLATDNDWTAMAAFLTSEGGSSVAMKLKSTAGWYQGGNGDNSSGFNAVAGGRRFYDGSFVYITRTADFWTSEYSSTQAWARSLYNDSDLLDRIVMNKTYGFSVRCVKD